MMAYSFGYNIKVSVFGESHNELIGATIDGLPANINLDLDLINSFLSLRKANGITSTKRVEPDKVEFISGLFDNKTDGTPLTFVIKNENVKSNDYNKGIIRPGTSDLVAYYKYNGANDYRGSGSFSGRLTALYVVIGAICKQILNLKEDILVSSRISNIHGIKDESSFNYKKAKELANMYFPVIDSKVKENMINEITNASSNNDSVGGVIETVIYNLPIGIGEPLFNSIESTISSLLFSVGGIKGIEFGDGFDFVNKLGSESIDELKYNKGQIEFSSNHNGGINAGISNSNPVLFRCAIKPTPSIAKEVNTINLDTKENVKYVNEGRHDPCICSRIPIVITSLTYFAMLDLYFDYLKGKAF